MENLNLILGICFVIVIFLSTKFNFFDKVIDSWIKIDDKISKLSIAVISIAIILFAVIWTLYRFL